MLSSWAGKIAVAGASGAVGQAALRTLSARKIGPLRAGSRRPYRASLEEVEFVPLDIFDENGLAAFCSGCDLVLNCAGPSYVIGDRVAKAAHQAHAHYVDACGDAPLHSLLSDQPSPPNAKSSVLSAGFVPGLSSLIPLWMAQRFDDVVSLDCYFGGLDRFSPAGAADYLIGLEQGDGDALAGWNGGRKVTRMLHPQRGVELPYFGGKVNLQPFMSRESERTAALLLITEGRWYSFFEGRYVFETLLRRSPDWPLERAVEELRRAAELDLVGHAPSQKLMIEMRGSRNGEIITESSILETGDTAGLTGWFSAFIVEQIILGKVEPGLHFAAEIADLSLAVERLRDEAPIELFVTLRHGLVDCLADEGVL